MTQELQILIEKARKMSPSEQFELIAALSQSLSHIPYPKSAAAADFEKSLTIEEIVQNQKTKPVREFQKNNLPINRFYDDIPFR